MPEPRVVKTLSMRYGNLYLTTYQFTSFFFLHHSGQNESRVVKTLTPSIFAISMYMCLCIYAYIYFLFCVHI